MPCWMLCYAYAGVTNYVSSGAMPHEERAGVTNYIFVCLSTWSFGGMGLRRRVRGDKCEKTSA